MENNEKTEENPQENNRLPPAKWGAKTRFGTGQGQPSNEAKRAGWAKKRRREELAQYLLSLEFVGKSEAFREAVGNYFGMSPEEMAEASNESLIYMRLIANAIEKGDVSSALAIIERAYGKPKETINLDSEEDTKPIINITIHGAIDTPPIEENFEEDEQENNGTPTVSS